MDAAKEGTPICLGDIVELHLEDQGMVLSTGATGMSINSLFPSYFYPTVKTQGAAGYSFLDGSAIMSAVRTPTKGTKKDVPQETNVSTNSGTLKFKDIVLLQTSEKEAGTSNLLRASFWKHLHTAKYDSKYPDMVSWMLLPSFENRRTQVEYGDHCYLVNLYYKQFIRCTSKGFLSTTTDRKQACKFRILAHLSNPSASMHKIISESKEKEKKQQEREQQLQTDMKLRQEELKQERQELEQKRRHDQQEMQRMQRELWLQEERARHLELQAHSQRKETEEAMLNLRGQKDMIERSRIELLAKQTELNQMKDNLIQEKEVAEDALRRAQEEAQRVKEEQDRIGREKEVTLQQQREAKQQMERALNAKAEADTVVDAMKKRVKEAEKGVEALALENEQREQALKVREEEMAKLRHEAAQKEAKHREALDEIELLKDQTLCVVCMEFPRRMRFDPCGHVCCCDSCVVSTCPVCQAPIQAKQTAYV